MTIANTLKAMTIAAAVCCTAGGALGQVAASLPASIVQSGTLNAAGRQQIQDYVQALTGSLQTGDIRTAARARDDLVKPLNDRDVSVAFRQAYSQSLSSLMNEQSSSEDIQQRFTALRLAGELGTGESVRLIRSHLNSEDAGIRVFAIGRGQRVFEVTSAHGPAISAPEAVSLVEAIAGLHGADTDPVVSDAIVRALGAGTALPGADLSIARNKAIQELALVVSPMLRTLAPTDNPESAYRLGLRASSAMTVSVTDVNADIQPQSIREAVGLAGDVLSVPLRQILEGNSPEGEDRELAIRAVQSAEALLYFARRQHGGPGRVEQTGLAEMLQKGDDRAYRNQVSLMFAANSEILRAFDLENDRFVR